MDARLHPSARRLAVAFCVAAALLIGSPALAHDGPLDSQGGHDCKSTDRNCSPLESYHCHDAGCVQPSGRPVTTVGGSSQRTAGSASPAATANAQPVTTPVATSAPTAAASPRALTNTGTITEVLGWVGLAVVLFGLALVLFAGPRWRRAAADGRSRD